MLAVKLTETYLVVAIEKGENDYQLLLFHRAQDRFF